MNSGQDMVLCPHCGSPLALVAAMAGRCRSCHGTVSFAESDGPSFDFVTDAGLVPSGLDTQVVAPFIDLTLASLGQLARESVVQQYASAEPEALKAIRELSEAVAGAGTRVRDTGQMRDSFDQNLTFYTAEEIWLFDLAIDVIAMLGSLGGLPPGTHASVVGDLRLLDNQVTSHHWKKELRRAADGPASFRNLRAHVPRHQPHPSR